MKRNIKSGQGIGYSIFGGNKLTQNDVTAIQGYANALKTGASTGEAWKNSMKGCSVAAKQYVLNARKAGKSTDEMVAGLKEVPKATNAASIGIKALSIAGNVLFSMGISFLISGIFKLINASEDVAQKAQELGESFKTSKSEIEDYKTKIEELYTTINDSGSSITEVTTARQNLMAVQDELIEKFGDEEGAINNITDAINGQVDALDELTQKEWEEKKSEYNGGKLNWFLSQLGYGSSIDRMLRVMDGNDEGISGGFEIKNNDENSDFIEYLNKIGYINDDNMKSNFVFPSIKTDNLEDYYDKLVEIKQVAEDFNVDEKVLTNIDKEITDAKNNLDKYGEIYNQYVLYEEVFPNDKNSDYYSQLTEAYKEYQDAHISGDEEATTKAKENYAKIMDAILDSNASDRVKEFFKDLYPDLQEEVNAWQFKVDFYTDDGDESKLGKKVNKHLDTLGADDTGDILNFNYESASKEEKKAYDALVKIAQERKMSIEELVQVLQTMGILQDEKYQQLIDTFGKDNVDTLTDEDLQFAYEIKNIGDLTFEEFVAKIQEAKESANKIDVSSILSGVQSLSTGLDQLDKIYADIKDGEYFDFSSILNNKEFTEAFGGLGESYENFIQTITNSPSDIKACQSAFNDLATAYINNSGALANVTEETKNSTIEMLKQMGIANAEEVVTAALTKAKAKQSAEEAFLAEKKNNSAISSSNLADATWQEVYAVWAESTASETAKQYLAQLALSKLDVQGIKINTKSDIDNIVALANAAGTSTEYLNALKKALSTMQNFDGKVNYGYALIADPNERAKHEAYVEAENTVNDILNSVKNTQLKSSDFYAPIDYTGGSTSNKDGGGKETKETFDWIEIAISRLQRTITNLGKTVSATWKSWTDRNSALKSQISSVTQEINKQQQAYNKYMSLANSVGLDPYYQSLVQNGAMDISTITDETLAEQIKTYQDYFEKALAAKDATIDLQDELANLARTEFDNVAKQFDSEISLVEQNISTIESYIDQVEMKGNLTSKNLYSTMYEEESKNLSLLQQKYEKLSDTLSNGTIKQNSEEWNSMAVEVKEVKQAIIESTTALEEYQKTMRELDWEVFDLIQDKISNVISESEGWIELLSNSKLFDDDGSITSQGQATLGLHVANLRVYENQVNDYAKAIKDLDTQFANDSLDKDYLERRQELLELQRESILNCESEKGAIKDLMNEGFDSLLSYMDELISKRKELLSQASDTRSFQKSVQEQTSEISRLQNILNSYNGDLSEEAKASIQKYEVELKEAESNLEDTLYDQYISDQEKMLDTLADATEQWINTRLDNIDGLIQDVVTSVDNNSSSIEETLKNEVSKAGGILSTEMQNIWSSNDNLTSITDGVNNTLLDIKNLVEKLVDTSVVDTSTLTQTQGWNQNSDGTWNYRNASGENVTGWHKLDWNGKQDWYSFDENGTMRSNQWIHNDSGTWSYVNGSGSAVTGWQNLNWQGKNDWYAFDEEGNMKANQWVGDYFVGVGGQMLTDTWVGHDGMYYYVGSDGKWLNLPTWTSNGRPNDGYPIYEYAKGSKHIPFEQLALLGEAGQELKYDKDKGTLSLVGEGDMVWTNEQTKRLWELSKNLNPVVPNVQMPNLDFNKIKPSVNNTDIGDVTFDIKMYGVNDPQEMAQQVKKIYQDNLGDVRKTIRADVYGGMLGKNSLTRYKY